MIQIIVMKPQRTIKGSQAKQIQGRITLFDMLIFQLKQDHFMSTAINFGTFLAYSYGQKFIQVYYLELLSRVHYIILMYKGGNMRNVSSINPSGYTYQVWMIFHHISYPHLQPKLTYYYLSLLDVLFNPPNEYNSAEINLLSTVRQFSNCLYLKICSQIYLIVKV